MKINMMYIARIVCYCAIGGILESGGITWRDWQLYAALGLVFVACTLSEVLTVKKYLP
jgi:hypothetical protein